MKVIALYLNQVKKEKHRKFLLNNINKYSDYIVANSDEYVILNAKVLDKIQENFNLIKKYKNVEIELAELENKTLTTIVDKATIGSDEYLALIRTYYFE